MPARRFLPPRAPRRVATVSVHTSPLDQPGAGDAAMTEAVARLGAAGLAVTELSLHLPSLDEVFFTLTGRTAELQEAG